jgi:cyclopropane fatty-acyl-phospholipid synthase-like methyltransferase
VRAWSTTVATRHPRVGQALNSFPLTAKYDPRWIADNALGENALCQTESLARQLPFRAGMRVLDLGCGKATSSIFLAREFGVEVWAVDKTVSPSDNRQRATTLDRTSRVFPLRIDARRLPFANEFFDAVIGIDSFLYFATDERFLGYLVPFIKPRGYIGVVDIGFTREVPSAEQAPEYLRREFAEHWSYVHTLSWWRQHWEKTGLVDVQYAELLPESDALLRDYIRDRPPAQAEDSIMRASRSDHDGLISLFCLVARKR